MRRASQLAAALFVAVALAACPNEGSRPAKDAGAPGQPPAGHAAVKVPLPDGWSARASADGVLWAGPPGRDVIRLEVHPGQAGALPSADALARELQASVQGVEFSVMSAESSDDSSIAIVVLSANSSDGGIKRDVALIGAKRAGGDLFLCSTAPGATEDEVKAAATACEKLAYAAP